VLGGLAASGWHVASITMRLWTESVPIAGGIVDVGGTIAWLARARPGDSLEVHAEIADVKRSTSNPQVGTIIMISETRNQHDRVV
jgi:acyl dehydratase